MRILARLLTVAAAGLVAATATAPAGAVAMGSTPAAGGASAPVVERYPAPQDGVFRVVGAGWGHGRGMSQWGAYQAALEGHTHEEILAFYYPGTTLEAAPGTPVRVLLSSFTSRSLVVRAVPGLTATFLKTRGLKVKTLKARPRACEADASRWRARSRKSGISIDAYCGGWRRVVKPRWMAPGATVAFEVPGDAVATENGSVRKGYRGQVVATRLESRSLRVVNHLPMDQYLRSVVAAEVSPSWPTEALRAQAIAARTYAAHEMLGRAGQPFDVYDSVRSQAYPGAADFDAAWRVARWREDPRTDAAVAGTAGLQVMAGSAPALTQFSSSNGGASAATTLPYMVAQVDEWDSRAAPNSRRSWTVEVSVATLARRYPGAGEILAVQVGDREGVGPWGGRVGSLRIVGTERSYTVTGEWAIRQALGVSSNLLTFAT